MQAKNSDWYKNGWSLDIKVQSWVEDTEKQVDFLIKTLSLSGNERILDLACGYGRHALSLAKRGFTVVGVDITTDFVDDATQNAREQSLPARFIQSDIRDVDFNSEFDVVLNMAEGAIGYLENDEENLKIFDVISKALKPGGKHFMDVCNADHAEHFFPKTNWELGDKAIALAQFDWDKNARRMQFGSYDILYGIPAEKPDEFQADSIRLYSALELTEIFEKRNMKIIETYSDFNSNQSSYKHLPLLVYSAKL
jgi:2-polyprenyl-3-methyl-5-hydroxy-6-metoxy-1,4-benzoquinol methylase